MADLAEALLQSLRDAQRERDNRPCLTCGGDRLRPDFREPGQPCHAPRTEKGSNDDR